MLLWPFFEPTCQHPTYRRTLIYIFVALNISFCVNLLVSFVVRLETTEVLGVDDWCYDALGAQPVKMSAVIGTVVNSIWSVTAALIEGFGGPFIEIPRRRNSLEDNV